jgi:hypothetical protein
LFYSKVESSIFNHDFTTSAKISKKKKERERERRESIQGRKQGQKVVKLGALYIDKIQKSIRALYYYA